MYHDDDDYRGMIIGHIGKKDCTLSMIQSHEKQGLGKYRLYMDRVELKEQKKVCETLKFLFKKTKKINILTIVI